MLKTKQLKTEHYRKQKIIFIDLGWDDDYHNGILYRVKNSEGIADTKKDAFQAAKYLIDEYY